MPWDGTELWVAEIAQDGSLTNAQKIAGGPAESIFQPEWSPDSALYFVSDRTGWWNLYRWRDGHVEALTDLEAEFGQPQWVFGMSTYAFVSEREVVCAYTQRGIWHLALLDTKTKKLQRLETPYTELSYVRATSDSVVFRGGSPTEMLSIVRLDLKTKDMKCCDAPAILLLIRDISRRRSPSSSPPRGAGRPTPSSIPQRTKTSKLPRAKSLHC
jgi:hypothetical protein